MIQPTIHTNVGQRSLGRQQFGNTCCEFIDSMPGHILRFVNDWWWWMSTPHIGGMWMITTSSEDMNTMTHILCVCYTRWLWLTTMNKHRIYSRNLLSTSHTIVGSVITKVNHPTAFDNTHIYDPLTIPTTHWQHIDTITQLSVNIIIRHNDHSLPRQNITIHRDIDDTINTMTTNQTLIRRIIIAPSTHRQYHSRDIHTTFTELEKDNQPSKRWHRQHIVYHNNPQYLSTAAPNCKEHELIPATPSTPSTRARTLSHLILGKLN